MGLMLACLSLGRIMEVCDIPNITTTGSAICSPASFKSPGHRLSGPTALFASSLINLFRTFSIHIAAMYIDFWIGCSDKVGGGLSKG